MVQRSYKPIQVLPDSHERIKQLAVRLGSIRGVNLSLGDTVMEGIRLLEEKTSKEEQK